MRVFGAAAATQPTNYRTNNIKSLMSNFACGPRTHTQHKQSFRKTRAAHTQHAKILTTTNFVLLSSSSRKPQGRTQRNAATRGHNVNMFFFGVWRAGACASFAASLRILQYNAHIFASVQKPTTTRNYDFLFILIVK